MVLDIFPLQKSSILWAGAAIGFGAPQLREYLYISSSTLCWKSIRRRGLSPGTSSGSICTTTPAFANLPERAELDIPFSTMVPGSVDEGTSMPPGHMQKEKTPLPSTCSTKEYSAAGTPGFHCPWY